MEKGDLESALSEKLSNLDDKMDDFKEKMSMVAEKFVGLLEKFNALPKAEKDEMLSQVKGLFEEKRDQFIYAYAKFLFALLLVVVGLAFFGYKLYKSLMDREKKREEKKKLKQQKKKSK